jgi:DNA-binding GntR family transcriptional regulator
MMHGIDSSAEFIRSHQMLADRVLARDVPSAQEMLEGHLHSTINFVYPPANESDR